MTDWSSVAPADRLITLPPGIPKLTLGWQAVAWATKYLRQPNGPKAGQRFAFVDSQVRFLLWWYAVNEEGHWLFHRGVRRLSKGSGKSPFAAVLALVEFLAPVRLHDFDERLPGGCVGRPVSMPWVQIVATAESQTANTMRMVRALAPKGSRVVNDYAVDVGKEKFFLPPEGTLEQITSSSSAVEGAEATQVFADETELWLPQRGGDRLASTLLDNLAKSGSRLLELCNSWEPGRECVAEKTFEAWIAQEEGRVRGDSKILYDARVAPPDTDMADPESLRKALEYVYDDCHWVNIRAIMERIWDPTAAPSESRRKYLNQPVASDDAWTTRQNWALLRDPERKVEDGEEIVLFFDGSKSRDATALIGCAMSDGHVFVVGIWEPDPAHDTEDVVPVMQVDAAVERTFERYDVLAFFADVKEFEGFVRSTWPERYGEGLMVWAVPGGKEPQAIAWDMRSRVYDFTMAAELTRTEIADQRFTHDGNAILGRHVVNAREYANRWGISITKESRSSPRKIDGCVAMIGARMVRRLVLASKEYKKRQRRVTGKGRVIVLA